MTAELARTSLTLVVMDARKQDRIYVAKRAGLLARIAIAVGQERAESLMSAWEAETRDRSLPRDSTAFWTEVEAWMATATRVRR